MNNFVSTWIRVSTILLAVGLASTVALAQNGPADYPAVTITLTDDGIEAPEELAAGFYTLEVVNESGIPDDMVDVAIDRLKEGATMDDAIAASEALLASFEGEGDQVEAIRNLTQHLDTVGASSMPASIFALTPGQYLVSQRGPSLHTTLTVTAAETEVTPPEPDLTVNMLEFAFTIPDEVEPGEQLWEVQNVGEQVHHMILVKILEGRTFDDVMAFMESEEGEPPFEEIGYTAVLSPNASNYVAYDLEPGSYVALCFLPDYETGQPHVMLGMIDTFTVSAEAQQ